MQIVVAGFATKDTEGTLARNKTLKHTTVWLYQRRETQRKFWWLSSQKDTSETFARNKKKTRHSMTLPAKSGKRSDDCGFSFFLRQGASFINSWVDATCASFEDRFDFYFDYSPLKVITNISSHITQPVKRFSHYVMMCLFGQLHIREKSILTYVFLKGSTSSVKGCGLVWFVSNANHTSFSP